VRFARVASAVLNAAVCLTVASDASAQPPVIDGQRLPLGVDTFNVSYAGSVIGRGIMARSGVERGGRSHLLQVYQWRSAGGDSTIDSLFLEPASLRSIREVRVVIDTVIEVTFRGDSARVELRPLKGPTISRTIGLGPMAYSSAALDAIVAASSLSESFVYESQFFYPPPAKYGTIPISLRVTGSERVRDRRGIDRDSWVVAAATPGGGTTYWIDKATRAVLRFDTREGPAVIEFRR
jgi:hypothetical protein